MPPIAEPLLYVSLVELKRALAAGPYVPATTEHDEVLTDVLRQSDSVVRDFIDGAFRPTPGDLTETHSLDYASDRLVLRYYPVIALASLTCDGTVLDPADYDLGAEDGFVVSTSGAFPAGHGKLVVVYTAGAADQASVHPTVKKIVTELARRQWDDWSKRRAGMISASDQLGNFQRFGPPVLLAEDKNELRGAGRGVGFYYTAFKTEVAP